VVLSYRPFSVRKPHEKESVSAGFERVVGDGGGDEEAEGAGEGVLAQVSVFGPVGAHFGRAHPEEGAALTATRSGRRVVVRRNAAAAGRVAAVRVEETLNLHLHYSGCIVRLQKG